MRSRLDDFKTGGGGRRGHGDTSILKTSNRHVVSLSQVLSQVTSRPDLRYRYTYMSNRFSKIASSGTHGRRSLTFVTKFSRQAGLLYLAPPAFFSRSIFEGVQHWRTAPAYALKHHAVVLLTGSTTTTYLYVSMYLINGLVYLRIYVSHTYTHFSRPTV